MNDAHGYICSHPCYEYKGWAWEMTYSGPWPLRKDGTPRRQAGPKFWETWAEFDKLSHDEKMACRVGGGCVRF